MALSFNTTGPCFPDEHYMIPPERRLGRILDLIEGKKFFTLHAGRQTGKTTSLFWLVDHLNAAGTFAAVSVDLESAREQPDPEKAFRTVLEKVEQAVARDLPELPRPALQQIDAWLENPATAVQNILSALAAASARPLVVLFDEADGLVGAAMVSLLTQLREGYIHRRRAPFPSSVMLVGQRQVRDYVLSTEERRVIGWLGTTSPFNVTAEATTLGPFSESEVSELLEQHTAATGQRFELEAQQRIFELGQGHPWLTNALADQIVRSDVKDRDVPITAAHVEAAKETIIQERRSHIDSLVAKLREPRVRRILDPMIAGETASGDALDDDFAYVVGLGLVHPDRGQFRVANPIYREVIVRALTYVTQYSIHEHPERFVRPDGTLDMPKLMAAWQVFWRKDGHLAAEGFHYREAGPHLMLMAFLQRVINGGGAIQREYGLGRGALDLMISWKHERHAVEVKLRRDTETEAEALDQLCAHLSLAGLSEGWLVLFDLRKGTSWQDKLYTRAVSRGDRTIHIVGC